MSALFKPAGQLKKLFGDLPEIPVEAGTTVRETLVSLSVSPDIIAGVIVNGDLLDKDYSIQEGDVIKLMAVMGGGSC